MKRFYCEICKREIRVRRLPDNVTPVIDPITELVIGYSRGTCRHHDSKLTRRVLADRVRAKQTPHVKAPKFVAGPKKTKK